MFLHPTTLPTAKHTFIYTCPTHNTGWGGIGKKTESSNIQMMLLWGKLKKKKQKILRGETACAKRRGLDQRKWRRKMKSKCDGKTDRVSYSYPCLCFAFHQAAIGFPSCFLLGFT